MSDRIIDVAPHLGGGSCLSRYVESFKESLTARNYSPATIKTYQVVLQRLTAAMRKRCIEINDLSIGTAAELVRIDGRTRHEPQRAIYIARRFVKYLIDMGVVSAPALSSQQMARASLRSDYENYLRRQRGLRDRSIYHCWRFADRFLDHRFGKQECDLPRITLSDIIAFLQHLTTRHPPFKDRTASTHLRNFFHYLFARGITPTDLAVGIPSVAQHYGARLPRYLEPAEVETLLASLPRATPLGRRNYAMVLTLARLGLRAVELVAIQLEDIDWRAGGLMVRGKGQRHDRVPLPSDVGAAIADYVRRDRVSTSRALFVQSMAPHGPFVNGHIVNAVLKEAFIAAGLQPPCKYVGSHVLRHSLATNLVRHGGSLSEVADMLRHRSRVSTMIYAKLDIEGLRTLAQPWPTTGGAS